MYSFESLTELADAYRAKMQRASDDSKRIANMIREFERRCDQPDWKRTTIETNMKNMGGVTYQRECLRGANAERLAWSYALEMLEGVIAKIDLSPPEQSLSDRITAFLELVRIGRASAPWQPS